MSDTDRTGRLLYATGVGLFLVAMVAGIIQSMRVDGRLPAIDLLMNGSGEHVNQLVAQKKYEEAIQELEMLSRMGTLDSETRALLARLREDQGKRLAEQGRWDECLAQFEELVRLRPGYAEGYCYLGAAYIDTNQPSLAARNFTQALDLNPRLPSAYNGLGLALAQLGEFAEAEKCFAKAIELAPNYVAAQANLDRARKALRGAPSRVK